MLAITIDIDWAPDAVIADTIGLLTAMGIQATFFATHKTSLLNDIQGIEVGIHPNFLPSKDYKCELDRLMNLYPQAKGVRCHSYYQNTQILALFVEYGLQYDSNLVMFGCPNIQPFKHWNGLIRMPVFWEDDINCLIGNTWEPELLSLSDPNSLYVFNFHPIHVYLNTDKLSRYEAAKPYYHDPIKLREFVNHESTGIGTRVFLKRLLTSAKEHHSSSTLIELATPLVPNNMGLSKLETYSKSPPEEKTNIVQANFETRNGTETYATSRDFNLRELEISFIIKSVKNFIKFNSNSKVNLLDIGCGNGYTDIRIAQEVDAKITGLDFSQGMISGAQFLSKRFQDCMLSMPTFNIGNVCKLPWGDTSFDIVISERCLLNLPDRDTQHDVILEVHRVLREGGIYIMVEGTHNGLRQLNELRVSVGLQPIPDRAEDNVSSLKFEEEEIEGFLSKYFKIAKKQHFGMYYLISRVVHPLLVFPDAPKFDAKINEVARVIALNHPDYNNMGHVVGFVLEKCQIRQES